MAEGYRWQRLPDMPFGAVSPAASVSGDQLIVTGGIGFIGQSIDSVQIMDLPGRTWTRVLKLRQARFGHGQVTLLDGRVLVVGGRPYSAQRIGRAMTSCELIDPTAEQPIQPAADLPKAMSTPTLHRLSDGRVVAIGNRAATIYHPDTNQWSQPIELANYRKEHRSLLLNDRVVLIVGGTGKQTFETVDLLSMQSHVDYNVRLPQPLDDMALARLPDGRVWVIGGQLLTGLTIDQTWIIRLNGSAPASIQPGPTLGLPAGISDHVLIETRFGLVIAGGEAENVQDADTELTTALLLDPVTLDIQRLPDTEVPHDDAAAVAWDGSMLILGGQAPGKVLGVERPTAVRSVSLLVYEP